MGSAGDLTGALIANKYELLRQIGRGGMGAVYEARSVTTLRRCAVKVLLSPELSGDGEVVKRFFREARASGLIESEHVVAAFDSGMDDQGHAYYVMECLLGEDLETTLERLGQLSPLAAIKIVLQAATGLASAHALGIVHRDVKPANLFLAVQQGGEVKVKILDFGVAKVKMEVFNESGHTLTHSGSLLGTPLYMSPEQLRRASAIDESADVWSLGVVLFECLTGELPWGEFDGIGELVTAILTARVPHVQDVSPWIEPGLADVVQRALSRDTHHRLKDAAELRDALARLLPGDSRLYLEELRAPNDAQRSSRPQRLTLPDTVMLGPSPYSSVPVVRGVAQRARRRPLVTAAVGGGLVLGAVVGTLTLRPFGSSSPPPVDVTPPRAALRASPTAPDATDGAVPAMERWLEVEPPSAEVRVDGVLVPSDDGRVRLYGKVGSEVVVRASFKGRVAEQRVTLTRDGSNPSRLSLPPPPGSGKPVASGASSTTPPVEPHPAPSSSIWRDFR